MIDLQKFVPFSKVDSVRREVSGIVTAEAPDKDREVCDYEKSKPYYKAVIDEIGKATDGQNFFPLREMHQLSAVGKGIGFQFDDHGKEITMTFKVVDEAAWKKVEERVYTGFSQGGRKVGDQVPDPVFKGCMRYVANPSEISLVDNPCLPSAHFAYVKSDGSVEMRKFLKTEAPIDPRIVALEQEVNLLKAATAAPILVKDAKTKRVAGKDLTASSFAYVGDPDKTETWKFPIHDASHARNALARFNQAKGIPASEKGKVRAKIVAAAKKFGIDVASESDKIAAILATMRKSARAYINRNSGAVISPRLQMLDSELGKLSKGMYEVSRLAEMLEELSRLVFCVSCEQEWEMDEDSQLPAMLADNVSALAETLVEMVDEETRELVEEAKAHAQ
jgi:hypothetical protein